MPTTSTMETGGNVRLDKWLWAARVYKTRTLAAEACRAGHVKCEGMALKPAHPVRVGMHLTVQQGEITRTLRVLGLLERRVGAAVARQYVEDLTPPEEYQKRHAVERQPLVLWPKGMGRPTKKQRRQLRGLLPDA
ncbi:RNA-binding S4 domain-containing protein [Fontisphaera persica]|uniref:RNA-binding S4 domain-containing protein n=1 Tax=Fontisphaera persica TaxID=2974023 RepID=UPI0024BFE996|nr:RNA-binding S4 domain-containing protein [Fontisphaera persica]WCJ58429.1 RNA-binding S4 domain-containing protein [Fontisphaera persica]